MKNLFHKTIGVFAVVSLVGCSQAQSQDSQRPVSQDVGAQAPIANTSSVSTVGHEATFGTLVDDKGNMSLPANYREDWVMLGAWSIAGEEEADGIHLVYTQPGVASHFRETGNFPNGAVLVKELLSTNSGDYSTGHVSYAGDISGWFMMVKDSEKRFADNPLWGNGWGWAYFDVGDRKNTTTEGFRAECLGCHIPARKNDWVFTEAYPLLK